MSKSNRSKTASRWSWARAFAGGSASLPDGVQTTDPGVPEESFLGSLQTCRSAVPATCSVEPASPSSIPWWVSAIQAPSSRIGISSNIVSPLPSLSPPSTRRMAGSLSSGSSRALSSSLTPDGADRVAIPLDLQFPSYNSELNNDEIGMRDKGKGVDRSRRHMRTHSNKQRRPLPTKVEAQLNRRGDSSDLERMEKEIEQLKRAAQESKKFAKKQAKEIKDLKSRLLEECAMNVSHNSEIKAMRTEAARKNELITTIENSMQCQICMDLLYQPYSLPNCGHILCLDCLRRWFQKAPTADDDSGDEDDPQRAKTCPCCRAAVNRRPVPVFLVKSIVGAFAKVQDDGEHRHSPEAGEDPWNSLFGKSDDGRDTSEERSVLYDFELDGMEPSEESEAETRAPWWTQSFLYTSSIQSESDSADNDYEGGHDEEDEGEGEEDNEEASRGSGNHHRPPNSEDEEEASAGAAASENEYLSQIISDEHYVLPCWQPPIIPIYPQEYAGSFAEYEDEEVIIGMLRRGCTYPMIRLYSMEYSHDEGLVALVKSLTEPFVASERDEDKSKYPRLFLGWNVVLEEGDETGEMFVEGMLKDLTDHPERWNCRSREGDDVVYDMVRLVRDDLQEAVEYDSTDTELWVVGESYA